jgi:UDP-3-O-[3-hydroxymyristoyl] glucosamine N-acyltransferase
MIIENNKAIKIIGYPESSTSDGCLNWFSLESKNTIEIITPENFLKLKDKDKFKYQYFVGFSLDMNLRKHICDEIDNLNLDCITYIHDSCVVFENVRIGTGVGIFPFSSILYHANIQDHCIIETNCLIAHHTILCKGSIVHAGTLIAGKTTIGEYCTFGFKSSVINKINITNNVTLGAFSNATKDINKPGRYVGTIARYIGE